jgi:hypothetical protein
VTEFHSNVSHQHNRRKVHPVVLLAAERADRETAERA